MVRTSTFLSVLIQHSTVVTITVIIFKLPTPVAKRHADIAHLCGLLLGTGKLDRLRGDQHQHLIRQGRHLLSLCVATAQVLGHLVKFRLAACDAFQGVRMRFTGSIERQLIKVGIIRHLYICLDLWGRADVRWGGFRCGADASGVSAGVEASGAALALRGFRALADASVADAVSTKVTSQSCAI